MTDEKKKMKRKKNYKWSTQKEKEKKKCKNGDPKIKISIWVRPQSIKTPITGKKKEKRRRKKCEQLQRELVAPTAIVVVDASIAAARKALLESFQAQLMSPKHRTSCLPNLPLPLFPYKAITYS